MSATPALDRDLAELAAGLPGDALVTDPAVLARHRRDAGPTAPAGTPRALARPCDVAQVRHVLRWASRTGTPVVPQGARAGHAGGANAVDGAVLLSLAGLDRILEIDGDDRLVRCQAGVGTAALARAVAARGLWCPTGPDEAATVGGTLATGGNCCAGATDVLGLTAVLADGSVTHARPGGDLLGLLVGSEGTLGVIVEATLALRPTPTPARALLARFGTVYAAGTAVAEILAAGHTPSLLDLLDRTATAAVAGRPGSAARAEVVLVVAGDPAVGGDDVALMAKLCERAGAVGVRVAGDADENRRLHDVPLRVAAWARAGGTLLGDLTVPRSRLTALLEAVGGLADHHDVPVGTVAHAADGTAHPAFGFDPADPDSVARARLCHDAVLDVAVDLGGSVVGGHGVGRLKRDRLAGELDPAAPLLRRGIRRLLDPVGVLNPGAGLG
ncbi:FAD-linked oxidase C-terminal domain-containing protein [Longispora sp. K20-0274]|uniref:FAD-binding oxidoreductase n=1 Tax=Longispora sp. K20-0274 TaxID=3088255 RepID=UPI0039996E91